MRSTLFLLIIIFFISCSNSDENNSSDLQADANNACTAENPLEVPWMQELKDSLHCGEYSCEVSILKSTYKKETVFYTSITDPACNSQPHYFFYDCEGKLIKELTNKESTDYAINTPDRKTEILFSCNGMN